MAVIARPRSLGQRRRGGVLQCGCQPLRASGRDQPVRHRILWVVQGDLDRRLDVGPKHQVSSRIGLDASPATCLLSGQRATSSDIGVLDGRPADAVFPPRRR